MTSHDRGYFRTLAKGTIGPLFDCASDAVFASTGHTFQRGAAGVRDLRKGPRVPNLQPWIGN